ncbi:L-threonylcarbamoyladenylate synthase [Fodinibius salinus]|uniref:Threonylcarbamoyl-AMP synthase n=1 Tax=Fodinibius salinus TaxID=860790 RepID=A0A5D3YPX7_9BACT|nr:L-threonylcarbamoyladenylate synthase [Fodinibius salinus]TYP95033.1 L-threonylcarbamoyladenylate synthase [Fodinibius salinus]
MLNQYISLIKEGQPVAFPTETVYGLGADAQNRNAIQKVFKIKGRPADNPLIVHVSDRRQVQDFATDIHDDAEKLMDAFWPGPLTLIFRKKPEVLDIITAGLDTVALRWPNHPLSQQLITQTGPLVAPSANSSGRPSPTKPKHVKEDFGDDFPVINAGETNIGLESTVLDVSQEPYRIYRPGAISAKQIEQVIDKKVEITKSTGDNTPAKSPGTKYTHYSPTATVRWMTEDADLTDDSTLYILHNRPQKTTTDNILHYQGDYERMAHELYDRFRQADHGNFTTIAVEPFSKNLLTKPMVSPLLNRIEKAIG